VATGAPDSRSGHQGAGRAEQRGRAAGLPVAASWIDAPFNHDGSELSADEWAKHWDLCCREAAEADITLMCACAEERQMGALVEVGCALGAGRPA
jgi:hypothetical protein